MAASSCSRGLAEGAANRASKTSPCHFGEGNAAGFADKSRHNRSNAASLSPGESAAMIVSSDVFDWLDTVADFASAFGHAVGRADHLAAVAERMDVQHLKGITACRSAFT